MKLVDQSSVIKVLSMIFFFDVFAYGSGVESIHGVICRMVLLREGL